MRTLGSGDDLIDVLKVNKESIGRETVQTAGWCLVNWVAVCVSWMLSRQRRHRCASGLNIDLERILALSAGRFYAPRTMRAWNLISHTILWGREREKKAPMCISYSIHAQWAAAARPKIREIMNCVSCLAGKIIHAHRDCWWTLFQLGRLLFSTPAGILNFLLWLWNYAQNLMAVFFHLADCVSRNSN